MCLAGLGNRDQAAHGLRRFDHRDRPMVLLDDYLNALLDLLQYGMDVSGKFCFGNTDSTHVLDHNLLPAGCLQLPYQEAVSATTQISKISNLQ